MKHTLYVETKLKTADEVVAELNKWNFENQEDYEPTKRYLLESLEVLNANYDFERAEKLLITDMVSSYDTTAEVKYDDYDGIKCLIENKHLLDKETQELLYTEWAYENFEPIMPDYQMKFK